MKLKSLSIFIAALTSLCACSKSSHQSSPENQAATATAVNSGMPIFPASASQLKPISLPDLIFLSMPEKGTRGWKWSSMSGPEIQWITDGYFTGSESNYASRMGFARVRVGNSVSTVLKKQVNELAWTITMTTFGNPKFGPTQVSIEPGVPNIQFGAPDCLGVLFSGCAFKVDQAINTARFNAQLICKNDPLHDSPTEVYKITAPEKEPSLLFYNHSEGSGGESSWVEIHALDDEEKACNPASDEPAGK